MSALGKETEETLEGPHVLIRPWLRRDSLAQEQWPRYTEPFSSLWNVPRSIFFSEALRANFSSQRFAWAIEDHSGHLIGRISLREIEPARAAARLGISISQTFVSQGLGTEALIMFLDYYFGPLGFRVMNLDVAAFNRRAVRCYLRLGFEHVESEWRNAGNDPSLRLLEDPRYQDVKPHFRRGRFETSIEFYEMVLTREQWLARHYR
ncbi:MAG: GNAT family N-acetyltransferase [Oscillochloris sp.]|nr:GNAT family N-acetyltransferase [Oscillochloris sp.]